MRPERLYVDGVFYVLLALAVLLLPLKWLLAALFAGSFHEFCHYLSLRISGVEVRSLRIYPNGAMMLTGEISAGKEIICALSGPLGGAALLLLAPIAPHIAVCALVQTCFNLLPIYPLDGGRVLRAVLRILLPLELAFRLYKISQIVFRTVACAFGIYLAIVLQLGIVPLAALLFVFTKKDLANQSV